MSALHDLRINCVADAACASRAALPVALNGQITLDGEPNESLAAMQERGWKRNIVGFDASIKPTAM